MRFTADVPVEVIEQLPPERTGPDAHHYGLPRPSSLHWATTTVILSSVCQDLLSGLAYVLLFLKECIENALFNYASLLPFDFFQ